MICKFAYRCHIGLLKSYRYFMTYRDMISLHLTSGWKLVKFCIVQINTYYCLHITLMYNEFLLLNAVHYDNNLANDIH